MRGKLGTKEEKKILFEKNRVCAPTNSVQMCHFRLMDKNIKTKHKHKIVVDFFFLLFSIDLRSQILFSSIAAIEYFTLRLQHRRLRRFL